MNKINTGANIKVSAEKPPQAIFLIVKIFGRETDNKTLQWIFAPLHYAKTTELRRYSYKGTTCIKVD